MKISDVEHQVVDIDATRQHAYNQVHVRRLRSGRLVAVYNEERFRFHHDSGQTVMIVSDDDGATWTDRRVLLPYTDTTGNWDCGVCELDDGTLVVNFTMAGYFKRGIRPEQPSWATGPRHEEHGDWTWSYRLMAWLGTYVIRSDDGGATWSEPIPVNARPLKHAGCRLGCWQMPGGELLMGVYGRIRGYGEEGENESTRSALLRSDDGGFNWEYYSTLGFDAASIVDFEEPAIVRLADGRIVCMLRTHVNPSGDAKNMAIVVSDDDGFSWSRPKFTNIWGYPAEFATLPDGRVLMIYGYRRPPYGVRGIVSEDGLRWDVADEFVIREGGVPAAHVDNPGLYQHIGYPSVALLGDGSMLAMYHEYTDDDRPIQHVVSTRFRLDS
jgi:sialidase-1